MEIFETINSPATGERLFFSKDNMTLYSYKEIVSHFGQQIMDIIDKNGKVTITPLHIKYKKDEKTKQKTKKKYCK